MRAVALVARLLCGSPVAVFATATGESCFVADLHQREPQKIQALPQVGVTRVYVILGESDAPDAVNRACLNDDARTSTLEECIQLRVLRELGLVGPDHNCIPVLQPIVFVESAYVAAKRLGRVGRRRLEHLSANVLIAEQGCFLCHHEMFGSRVALPVDNKFGFEPLAEARSGDSVPASLVSPEKDIVQIFSSVEAGVEVFQIFGVVQLDFLGNWILA